MDAFKIELRALIKLALPVALLQLGLVAMSVVDTLMVGHLEGDAGGQAVAAVGVGGFCVWLAMVFSWGCLLVLDPIISQAVGAKDEVAITLGLQRGLVLAVMLSLPAVLVLMTAAPVLYWLGQSNEIVPEAATYSWLNAPGVLAWLLFVVFRQTLQALHIVWRLFACILVANVLNAVVNYALIYGQWGCPKLGVAGAAWATSAARIFLLVAAVVVSWQKLCPHLAPRWKEVLKWRPLAKMLRMGAPIGMQFLLEFGIFGFALVMIGWISVPDQAGHQLAINLASVTFMVPLGVSAAAAVRVGYAIGRADPAGVRRAAGTALMTGVLTMACFAIVMLTIPSLLASFYTDHGPTIHAAALLIPIAGVFQVFDGLQVVSLGILRGAGDTHLPAVISMVGYWAVGLPVAWYLGLKTELGAQGVWWGLTAGLISVSILLVLRVRTHLKKSIERVVIDR